MSWLAGRAYSFFLGSQRLEKSALFSFSDYTRQAPKQDTTVTAGPTVGHGLLDGFVERIGGVGRPYQAVTRTFGA